MLFVLKLFIPLAFNLHPQIDHSTQQLGLNGLVKEVRSCTRMQNSSDCIENEVMRFDSNGQITFSSSAPILSDSLSEVNTKRLYRYEGYKLKFWSIFSAKDELLVVHEYFYDEGDLRLECIKDMRTGSIRGRKYIVNPDGYEESGFEVNGSDTVMSFPVKRVKMSNNLVESETFISRSGEIRRTIYQYTAFGALLTKVSIEHGIASCTYKAVYAGTKLSSDSTYDGNGKPESYRTYTRERLDHLGNWIEQDFVIVNIAVPAPLRVQRYLSKREIIYY